MKKTILTLTCFLSFLISINAQIVITEIMYNPPPSGTDTLEYVELYNNTNGAVNVSGWHFTQGFAFTFPPNTVIPANGYVIISENVDYFSARFPGLTTFLWDGALTNSGEDIVLTTNDSTQVVDIVDYTNMAPWPTEANGSGPSLVLCDPNSDNADATNWNAASTSTGVFIAGIEILATPGAGGGCATELNAKPDNFTSFPNQTSTLDVLANDDIPDPANITVEIVDNPQSGIATLNPDNTIDYSPNNNFCGSDAFTYRVCDPGKCDTAEVSLSIPCYPAYTIAQVTSEDANGLADSVDVSCELTGYVYGVNTRASATGVQFTLIDGTNAAGINVFNTTSTLGYTVKEKDQIKVKGVIAQFNGLTEIIAQEITLISGGNTLSAPQLVVRPEENTESRLIQIKNLHFVNTAQWATGVGAGFNVQAVSDDFPQDTIVIRIDNDIDLYNQPAPPQPFDLTGLGGQFDASSPYLSDYQIAPRYTADVSSLVGTKTADFSASVRLTPNPVSDRLLLQTDLQFDRVRIFNAIGVLAVSMENPAPVQSIQVETFPAGVYFIQFEKDNAAWTTRFVKQ